VTGSGTGSFAATIAAGAVTFAKMQSSTAASVLLGRGSASGAGAFQEITLGTGLAMSGTSVTVSATVKRTVFSASGTWTKDSRAVLVRVTVYGGGGSGGSGACVASGVGGSGGGGGGGASLSQAIFDAAALGATETVTVGAGGASVAGVSATGAGTNGNAGGDSSFGAWLTGYGGGRGGAGNLPQLVAAGAAQEREERAATQVAQPLVLAASLLAAMQSRGGGLFPGYQFLRRWWGRLSERIYRH
jgi:hypothetical protein